MTSHIFINNYCVFVTFALSFFFSFFPAEILESKPQTLWHFIPTYFIMYF